jgi:hypothetical protein
MNPLLMGALTTFGPQILKGAGQALGGMAGGYADAQAVARANMPAQDPTGLGQQMTMQAQQNFDPNGAVGRGIEQQQLRQQGQQYNIQNQSFNQALKRSNAADSYKNAMAIGKGAIDQYLQNSGNNMNAMNQALGMRY